jgi:hypothetical protein
MLNALNRNSGAIQALAALLTVLLAAGALLGVKLQIDSADRIQREQSARDIYREYLNLAVNKPEFSSPDYCALAATPQAPAYEHFVEYVLYTAEQAISVDESWNATFAATLEDHSQYICQIAGIEGYSDQVSEMLNTFKRDKCAGVTKC